jgi:predicted secreted hydrolase
MTQTLALLLALVQAVAASAPGWRSASRHDTLTLPRDHGSHPDYKIEWWYYTGNLTTASGRRFGYQLTFFRVGVDREPINPSRWTVRDLYMAHFAVTDIEEGRHRFAERLNRAGIGWAGAATGRLEVWNEDWRASVDPSGRHVLAAADGSMRLALQLDPGTRWTRQGEDGYSRKGATAGNASLYYSLTRMNTRGAIEIDGVRHEVSGLSWMDHEFGTSFLEPGQQGWDWFSLQFDDGSDLMMFQLRTSSGAPDPYSSGTLVRPDGSSVRLGPGDFTLTPGRRWRSPESGASYPVEWQVALPGRELGFEVTTEVPAQELRTGRSTGVTYWEGSVRARGRAGGRSIEGRGYLEMTGYAGVQMSEVLR